MSREYIKKVMNCCNEYPMFRAGIFVECIDIVFQVCEMIYIIDVNKNCKIISDSFGQMKVQFQNGSYIFIGTTRECCNTPGQRFHVVIVEDKDRSRHVYDCLEPCATLKSPVSNFGGLIWA